MTGHNKIQKQISSKMCKRKHLFLTTALLFPHYLFPFASLHNFSHSRMVWFIHCLHIAQPSPLRCALKQQRRVRVEQRILFSSLTFNICCRNTASEKKAEIVFLITKVCCWGQMYLNSHITRDTWQEDLDMKMTWRWQNRALGLRGNAHF